MSDDNDAPQGGPTTDDDNQRQDPPQDQRHAAQPGRQPAAGKSDPAPDDEPDPGKTFTQAELDKILNDRLARERSKFSDYNDLKTRAAKLQEIEDAQKTEQQRLNDQLAAREVELATFRTEKLRNDAGRAAGLDPEMWEFITASDPDGARAQADRLVARMTPPDPPPANLHQGARPTAKSAPSANDVLRGMAGYQ